MKAKKKDVAKVWRTPVLKAYGSAEQLTQQVPGRAKLKRFGTSDDFGRADFADASALPERRHSGPHEGRWH